MPQQGWIPETESGLGLWFLLQHQKSHNFCENYYLCSTSLPLSWDHMCVQALNSVRIFLCSLNVFDVYGFVNNPTLKEGDLNSSNLQTALSTPDWSCKNVYLLFNVNYKYIYTCYIIFSFKLIPKNIKLYILKIPTWYFENRYILFEDLLLLFFKRVLIYMSESTAIPRDQKKASDFLEPELQREVRCGCWKPNSSPLQVEHMPLTAEPSLQATLCNFKIRINIPITSHI